MKGHVVRLRSGGPAMTVIKGPWKDQGDDWILCRWWSARLGQYDTAPFDVQTIEQLKTTAPAE